MPRCWMCDQEYDDPDEPCPEGGYHEAPTPADQEDTKTRRAMQLADHLQAVRDEAIYSTRNRDGVVDGRDWTCRVCGLRCTIFSDHSHVAALPAADQEDTDE